MHRHREKTAEERLPPSSDCANGAARCTAMGKTAEERFHTLARGWLAYPVTPMHAHLPPKSGCRNAIPVCARGALLLVTPSARRDSGGRMGHRRAPPLCASEMRYFPLSARCTIIEKTAIHRRNTSHRRKTAEERFNMLARGWLAYPVTPTHALLPPKSGCGKKDRWLGFQPSVSVSLRSAVRLLVDNTTLFDTSLLACKVAQIVQFCTTHFTKLVDCDAVDKR